MGAERDKFDQVVSKYPPLSACIQMEKYKCLFHAIDNIKPAHMMKFFHDVHSHQIESTDYYENIYNFILAIGSCSDPIHPEEIPYYTNNLFGLLLLVKKEIILESVFMSSLIFFMQEVIQTGKSLYFIFINYFSSANLQVGTKDKILDDLIASVTIK